MNQTSSRHTAVRIMLVDDEPSICALLELILEPAGYSVESYTEGRNVLQALHSKDCDLLITDLKMPTMDGVELLQRVRLMNPTLPIIVCTANADVKTAMQLIRGGANDYILKPFNPDELLWTVRRTVEHARLAQENERFQQELQTKVQELEESFRENQNLTDMIVHDLKNPLSVVMARLEMFQLYAGGANPKQTRNIALAREACVEILNMTANLLDVSRFESGDFKTTRMNLEAVDLNDFLTNLVKTWEPVVDRNGAQLTLDLCDNLRPVDADRVILSRIWGNLISNAVTHSGEAGRVTISAEYQNGKIVFSISDSGQGIPPEWHEKIFEKFMQVKARQTGKRQTHGLGLTFCQYAVRAMKGRIWVESEIGKGTTFLFTLPVAGTVATQAQTEIAHTRD